MNLVREYFEIPETKRGVKKRFTKKEIADALVIPQSFLSTIISGHRKLPKAKELLFFKLAHPAFSKTIKRSLEKTLAGRRSTAKTEIEYIDMIMTELNGQ